MNTIWGIMNSLGIFNIFQDGVADSSEAVINNSLKMDMHFMAVDAGCPVLDAAIGIM